MRARPQRLRRLSRWAICTLALLVALPLLYGLTACALMLWPTGTPTSQADADIEAYVISNGVHTDLVLPLQAAGVDWRALFPLQHARAAPADAEFVAIGWGDREFYLHTPTWADLTLRRAVRAMLGRHPAALHVSWLQRAQLPPRHTWRLPLTAEHYRQLVQHVQRSLPEGQALPIAGAHYADNDAFYEATGHYHLLRTCNEWTAQGLRAAGAPVGRWAPFDFNVRWHLQPLKPARSASAAVPQAAR
ncbi:MAG: TIGR02117 family protein [Comamonadaceae bacterium]|nr:MAG: TIGR02117 family protein [Comamonadaceae bacterium]